jgi:hypothetical protein
LAVSDDLEQTEPAAASPAEQPAPSSTRAEQIERVAEWLRSENRLLFIVLILGIALAAAIFVSYGLALAMLVVAGGALVSVIALLWGSVQNLTGESALSFDEALSLAAPSAEEEQKRALLRALKDLEYERSVGKISEEDYQELSARYRQEAKRLLRLLEEEQEPARQRADELVRKRLVHEGLAEADAPRKPKKKKSAKAQELAGSPEAPAADGSERPGVEAEAAPVEGSAAAREPTPGVPTSESEKALRPNPTRKCPACEARNDLDARFCKRCGQSLANEQQTLCLACPAVYDSSLTQCPECGVERAAP